MDYNKAIESICFKFGHAVTEYDVFRWLRNFDENEWNMALNVLDKVVYYSSDRIDETIEYWLRKILIKYHSKAVYIIPSGSVGKSGHVMAYHAKKVIEKIGLPDNQLVLSNLKALNNIPSKVVLVLLDDFSGTGESIEKFFNEKVKEVTEKKRLVYCALTVAFMQKAEDALWNECGIKIYGDQYKPAFTRRGSVFGYEKNMVLVRDFCFKKGEALMPDWKNQDLKPLGYKNTQSLICFEHTTPNNTLPILWYEKEMPGSDKKWNAIFPRFASSRIDRGRRLRQSSNFWLSAMQKMNLSNIDWSRNHTTDSLRLISLVAQKYHQRSDYYIAQVLGISLNDLGEIIELGKNKGLIDVNGNLTIVARQIYEEIRKKDRILEHDLQLSIANSNIEKLYVPTSFRGIT